MYKISLGTNFVCRVYIIKKINTVFYIIFLAIIIHQQTLVFPKVSTIQDSIYIHTYIYDNCASIYIYICISRAIIIYI